MSALDPQHKFQGDGTGYGIDEEKKNPADVEVTAAVTGHNDDEHLQRQLKSRHSSMLALGGAIGTGLLLGSGTGLARAGPVGLLIAYTWVGSLCFSMFCALGEMAAFLPHQKGFPGHASRFVGPSFGAMVGWAYWLKYLFATPTQYTACAVVLNYWVPTSKVNNGVWIAIFIVGTGCLQLMPVRYFGEFEFWCSTFKIMTLTGLMLMALVVDLGGGPSGDRLGFRTWRELPFATYLLPGSLGRFLGFTSALISGMYAYTGTEMVGIALGEMRNPRKNVSRAVKACFYRILFLYCGSIFFVGLLVPADSKLLLAANKSSTNANASPFVVAINVAGIKVLPHIINAAAVIFVLSAANSDVYVNSRTAYSLAMDGNLPKIFAITNKRGTPYVAVCTTLCFSMLAFTSASTSAYTTFKYFVSGVTLMSSMVWMMICFTHIRFMAACKKQGINRATLPYYNKLNPFLSIYGLVGVGIISLTKGFDAFIPHFQPINFVVNYIAFPVVVVVYIVFSLRYRNWVTPIDEIDLDTGVRAFDEDEDLGGDDGRKPGVVGFIKYVWNS